MQWNELSLAGLCQSFNQEKNNSPPRFKQSLTSYILKQYKIDISNYVIDNADDLLFVLVTNNIIVEECAQILNFEAHRALVCHYGTIDLVRKYLDSNFWTLFYAFAHLELAMSVCENLNLNSLDGQLKICLLSLFKPITLQIARPCQVVQRFIEFLGNKPINRVIEPSTLYIYLVLATVLACGPGDKLYQRIDDFIGVNYANLIKLAYVKTIPVEHCWPYFESPIEMIPVLIMCNIKAAVKHYYRSSVEARMGAEFVKCYYVTVKESGKYEMLLSLFACKCESSNEIAAALNKDPVIFGWDKYMIRL